MLNWVEFYIYIYWSIIFIFIFNNKNIINLIIYSELIWIILYTISVVFGVQTNDPTSATFTFFILGFGGIEFVIGFMLLILLKNSNTPMSTQVNYFV